MVARTKARKPPTLTLKQQRLVDVAPLARTQSEAARLAGYSPNGSPNALAVSASTALKNPNVQAALKANLVAAGINPLRVLKEQAKAAFAELEKGPSWDHKQHALDQLGKYLRLWDMGERREPAPVPEVNILVLIQNPTAREDLSRLARMLAVKGASTDGAAEVLDV